MHLATILTPRGLLGKAGRHEGQSPAGRRRRRAPDSPGGGSNGADRTVITWNRLECRSCGPSGLRPDLPRPHAGSEEQPERSRSRPILQREPNSTPENRSFSVVVETESVPAYGRFGHKIGGRNRHRVERLLGTHGQFPPLRRNGDSLSKSFWKTDLTYESPAVALIRLQACSATFSRNRNNVGNDASVLESRSPQTIESGAAPRPWNACPF